MGGSGPAIEAGYIQREIGESAYRYQQALEAGDEVIVGVNRFVMQEQSRSTGFRVDESIRKVQMDRLLHLRSSRDNDAVTERLEALRSAATGTANLMPFILERTEAGCTLGEIDGKLDRQSVWLGKSVSERVYFSGRCLCNNKTNT